MTVAKPDDSHRTVPELLIILAVLSAFLYLCHIFAVAQDDAFISFRYAANFLNGEGLVFNIGERVEGYTNFLWIILVALFRSVFGLDFLVISRVLGILSGLSLFGLLYLLSNHNYQKDSWFYFLSASLMMLANPALPYWSTSGMETTAFALTVFAALVSEYRKPTLTPWLLALATLLRPDGVVAFGAVTLYRFSQDRKIPWKMILSYLFLLLPYAIFKITYYGSLLPNSYYAKSGIGLEYVLSGLEYFWFFCSTVGLYGAVFLVPLAAAPLLWKRFSLLYLFTAFYLFYIIWIGGDVLKVYRFFIPILAPLYILFAAGIIEFGRATPLRFAYFQRLRIPLTIFLIAGIASLSFYRGYNHAKTYQRLEIALVDKMEYAAVILRRYMGTEFSIATSTIGMLRYSLPGQRVFDMLGLTDRYIARNPELVSGLTSTWKERRFNSRYLLEHKPDFILFSTEYKPSAPAEQALFLHSEFRKNYWPIGFPKGHVSRWISIYKKWGEVDMSRDSTLEDAGFPRNLKAGFDSYNGNNIEDAILYFEQARQDLGHDYFMVNYGIGRSFSRINAVDSAKHYFERAISLNPYDWHSHYYLTRIAVDRLDSAAASRHALILARIAPWLMEEARRQGIGLPEENEGE